MSSYDKWLLGGVERNHTGQHCLLSPGWLRGHSLSRRHLNRCHGWGERTCWRPWVGRNRNLCAALSALDGFARASLQFSDAGICAGAGGSAVDLIRCPRRTGKHPFPRDGDSVKEIADEKVPR